MTSVSFDCGSLSPIIAVPHNRRDNIISHSRSVSSSELAAAFASASSSSSAPPPSLSTTLSSPSSSYRDPTYEFDAQQYRDFAVVETEVAGADEPSCAEWFKTQTTKIRSDPNQSIDGSVAADDIACDEQFGDAAASGINNQSGMFGDDDALGASADADDEYRLAAAADQSDVMNTSNQMDESVYEDAREATKSCAASPSDAGQRWITESIANHASASPVAASPSAFASMQQDDANIMQNTSIDSSSGDVAASTSHNSSGASDDSFVATNDFSRGSNDTEEDISTMMAQGAGVWGTGMVEPTMLANQSAISASSMRNSRSNSGEMEQLFGAHRSSIGLGMTQTMFSMTGEVGKMEVEMAAAAAASQDDFANTSSFSSSPVVELMDQFTAVADAERFVSAEDALAPAHALAASSSRTAFVFAPSSAMRAPSLGRKRSVPAAAFTVGGSVPSFMRSTAATSAKATVSKMSKVNKASELAAQAAAALLSSVATRRSERKAASASATSAGTGTATGSATPRAPAVAVGSKRRHESVGPSNRLDKLSLPRTILGKTRAMHEAEVIAEAAAAASSRPATSVKAKKPQLTIAQSPALVTRARAGRPTSHVVVSTEDELMKQIGVDRDEAARTIKANSASYVGELCSEHAPQNTMRSTQALTQPEEFTLHTAKRLRLNPAHVPTASSISAVFAPLDVTIASSSLKSAPLTLTKVQPFSLLTNTRGEHSRATRVLASSEDQEVSAISARPAFKALPLNLALFTGAGESGVPRVAKAKPTEASSPKFATTARSLKRKEDESSQSSSAAVNSSVGPSKVARRGAAPFHLATEERGSLAKAEFARKTLEETNAASAARAFVARPLVTSTPAPMTFPVQVAIIAHEPRCVETSRNAQAHFAAKVKSEKALAAEAARIRVLKNPFKSASSQVAQSPDAKHEVSMIAGESSAYTPMKSVEASIEESMHDEAVAAPVASSAPVVFVPVPSTKPLTTAQEPSFATSTRAVARAEFSSTLAATAAHSRVLTEAARLDAIEVQARERIEYRSHLNPKANPVSQSMLDSSSLVIKASTQQLTQPYSPMLITKRRAKTTRQVHAKHEFELQEQEEEEEVTMKKTSMIIDVADVNVDIDQSEIDQENVRASSSSSSSMMDVDAPMDIVA